MSVTDLHSRRAADPAYHICVGINRRWRVVGSSGRTYGEYEREASARLLIELLTEGTSGDASASRVTAG